MDTECRGPQQAGSSCWATGSAAWSSSQQKRQRCEGSSSDQVGSSTSASVQMSEPELPDTDYVENEEEDYYMDDDDDDDCDDDNGDDSEYEFDEADFNQQLADKFDDLDLPPGVEATVPWLQKLAANDEQDGASDELAEDEITKKYKAFQQFYTVQNFSDHHFANKSVGKTSREWAKRIQHDWKLLEKDLPASIFVRVAEDRMDLLRATIIGPKGTPYHDGLFFFDAHFTSNYPSEPPLVYYHSGGLRLNPNLYNCGKVCLSLLGTWSGSGCEKWNSAHSTMLQVLVSIQALILNEKPYFNEPGYAGSVNTATGQQHSIEYNKTTFLHSCRTMLYSLRRPPEHFGDLVAGHFRERGRTILAACKYYLEGNMVGSEVPEEEETEYDAYGASSSSSSSSSSLPKKQDVMRVDPLGRRTQFSDSLKTLFEDLLMEFNVKGADTRKFLEEKVKKNLPSAS